MMVWGDGDTGGVTVTVPDRATLMRDLADRFLAGNGFSVATLNLDHVVKLSADPAFLAAYKSHSHVTADGNPIVWLSRLAGQKLSLVPGSELVEPLAALAAKHKVQVALIGSTQDALEAAAQRLLQASPGLDVVLCRSPVMGFDPDGEEAADIIADISASGARLCFLALGAPKQEILAARATKALPHVGFVSVGAGLDFIALSQTRAPRWVQAIAAEWLWRLLSDPRRLAARYSACFLSLPGLVGKALRLRRQTGART